MLSQCDDGTAIKALFDLIFREPQKIMIVGPSCSTAAQAIASTAKFWNLNVVSTNRFNRIPSCTIGYHHISPERGELSFICLHHQTKFYICREYLNLYIGLEGQYKILIFDSIYTYFQACLSCSRHI